VLCALYLISVNFLIILCLRFPAFSAGRLRPFVADPVNWVARRKTFDADACILLKFDIRL
jgi:hypothetical protein